MIYNIIISLLVAFFIGNKIRKNHKERKSKESALIVGRKVTVKVNNGLKIVEITSIYRDQKVFFANGFEYKFKDIIF